MEGLELRVEAAPVVQMLPGFGLPAEVRQFGRVTATINENPAASNAFSLVTVHDVGMSSVACFQTFFNYALASKAVPELFALAKHVHIQIEGHGDNDARVAETAPWVSMADYANDVDEAVRLLRLDRVILMGVGAGGDVCTRYAMGNPSNVVGIVLVGSSLKSGGLFVRKEAGGLWWYRNMGENTKDWFMTRWISCEGGDLNNDLREKLMGALDRMEPVNVARYLYAYAIAEPLKVTSTSLRKGTRVLLLIGKDAPDHESAKAALGLFDQRATSIVDLDNAGTLVMEERPGEVATAVRLFFHGLGIIVLGK